MRKLIITVIVTMAVASALLLAALLSWTTYQHSHQRTSPAMGYSPHASTLGTWPRVPVSRSRNERVDCLQASAFGGDEDRVLEPVEPDPRPDRQRNGYYQVAVDIFRGELVVGSFGLRGRTEHACSQAA
jgi:hypothetical protein